MIITEASTMDIRTVKDFVLKWLPAHLMYKLELLLKDYSHADEKFRFAVIMALTSHITFVNKSGVVIAIGHRMKENMKFGIVYAKNLVLLDGTRKLDGSSLLNAIKQEEEL